MATDGTARLELIAQRGFRLPFLPGEPLDRPRTSTSTYFDTVNYRLASLGITLRRTVAERRSRWRLAVPRAEPLEVPGGPGSPPRELSSVIDGLLAGRELVAIAKLRSRRDTWQVRNGGPPLAEVEVDSVAAMEDRRVVGGFTEISVRATDDRSDAVEELARALRAGGAAPHDGLPTLNRSLGLARNPLAAPLPRSAPAGEHVRRMLQRQFAALLSHDPGTRLGSDPEGLHQMRVAARRLRSILRAGSEMFTARWADPLRTELAWLGGLLGPVRDLDVMTDSLRAQASELEPTEQRALGAFFDGLARERGAARTRMLEGLESDRYSALVASLEDAVHSPSIGDADVSLRALAAGELDRFARSAERLGRSPSDERLHRFRVKGKRMRYAAEMAEPAVGRRAARFVRRAKSLQDLIGDHQDACVAEERLREHVAESRAPATAFAAGRLVERQRAIRRGVRERYPTTLRRLLRDGRRAFGGS